jgi:protein-S-isoprenylcysteine O-methyltransferase Ste14
MDVRSVVTIGWLLFFGYWWISAIGVKKNVRGRSWGREVGVRLLVIAAIIVVARRPGSQEFLRKQTPPAIGSTQGAAGLIVCYAGFAFAVWARRHLGRNWGMPMTFKQGHEMVTTGPYRYVRHPIYTGMMLAILGSAVVAGWPWLVVFLAMVVYCVYSARTEERLMLEHFSEPYAEYKKRTKAFIPFVV